MHPESMTGRSDSLRPSGCVPAALHEHEEDRLRELYRLAVLDTPPDPRFDRITQLVSDVFDVPIVLISLVDKDRQWFKSVCGLDVDGTSREEAFCAHAILERQTMVVNDAAQDPRFQSNPLVTNRPYIRFYAGAVLRSTNDLPLGTLCLVDTSPRKFTERERNLLLQFARLVESELTQNVELAQIRVQSQVTAHLDPLTGFFNFAAFATRYAELHPNGVAADAPFQLALVSIPRLDFIRRHFGLEVYQSVLLPISQTLVQSLKDHGAIFGRHDQGALLVLLPLGDLAGEPVGAFIQRQLRDHCPLPKLIPAVDIHIAVSPDGDDLDATLYQCQFALSTKAEESGIVHASFTDQDRARLTRSNRVALRLIDAIKRDALSLHYQPKVNAQTGMLEGAEALLRWDDIELGQVSTGEIIQAAEASNMMTWLDRWLMKAVLRQMAAWLEAGLTFPPVSINLSGDSLNDVSLPNRIKGFLQEHGVPASKLQIEVLESALFKDLQAIVPGLQELKTLGVGISLDDFGTGFSSLSYLQRLPISELKIDRSFVAQLESTVQGAKLASGIISIAHDLGVKVVAEGVETPGQLMKLREFGCDAIQGFLFQRPLATTLFAGMLTPDFRFADPAQS